MVSFIKLDFELRMTRNKVAPATGDQIATSPRDRFGDGNDHLRKATDVRDETNIGRLIEGVSRKMGGNLHAGIFLINGWRCPYTRDSSAVFDLSCNNVFSSVSPPERQIMRWTNLRSASV
jgi:hypothetical protein